MMLAYDNAEARPPLRPSPMLTVEYGTYISEYVINTYTVKDAPIIFKLYLNFKKNDIEEIKNDNFEDI